jgi:hypothetical protein
MKNKKLYTRCRICGKRFRLMSNDAVQRVRIWGRLPCGKCKKRLELVRLEG